jgi:hypothetical protein
MIQASQHDYIGGALTGYLFWDEAPDRWDRRGRTYHCRIQPVCGLP